MPNHPNRGRHAAAGNPAPEAIKAARELVMNLRGIRITAAQDWCAAALHTQRRVFQQWETGARRMHPAFCELLQLKIKALDRL